MKKLLLSVFMTTGVFYGSFATPLSPEEALSRVSNPISPLRLGTLNQPKLSFSFNGHDGVPTVYVFNKSNNSGYMIVSADDNAIPLLGYTDEGQFDASNIAPALKYWLETYNEEISAARNELSGLGSGDYINSLSNYNPIIPMVTTMWDQDEPYNNDCILQAEGLGELKCVTGCVATAMAQVMNYFEYPEVGQGTITYQPYSNVAPLTLDFSQQKFDWANMLDTYSGNYTDAQASAVAYLMKACGYSVQMQYGQVESGASDTYITNALIEYFKYDKSTRYVPRNVYSATDWENLLYETLSTTGPVIYNGQATSGGHSFVCDGYDGNGYFHFNWGWSGLSNGYYLLSALNPSSQGIGSYAGGYNMGQNIIIVVPNSNGAHDINIIQYGSLNGEVSGNTLYLLLSDDSKYKGWGYIGYGTADINFGLIIEDLNNGDIQYLPTSNNVTIGNSQVTYTNITADLSSINTIYGNTYKATLAFKNNAMSDGDWIPVNAENGLYNYIIFSATDNGYEVETNVIKGIVVDKLEVDTVYFLTPVSFSAQLSNENDFELSRNITAGFYDSNGDLKYTTDNIFVTIAPNSTITKDWDSTEWYSANGSPWVLDSPTDFTLKLYYTETYSVLEGVTLPVTVNPEPATPEYNVNISFPVSTMVDNVLHLDVNKDIPVNLNLEITSGVYISDIEMIILAETSPGSSQFVSVYSQKFPEIVKLNECESKTYQLLLDFPEYDENVLYSIQFKDKYSSMMGYQYFLAVFENGSGSSEVVLPQYTVTPANSKVSPSELETVLINWGYNNLELVNPGYVYMLNGDQQINDLEVSLVPLNGEDNTVYEYGALAISLPQIELAKEVTYIIPANVVNVVIMGQKIPSSEITIIYTVDTETGISTNIINYTGNYVVYNLEGQKILETKELNDIQMLPKGVYIINSKKIMIK